MVRNIPERFKKVVFTFDPSRLCESSGSEHSPAPDTPTDLSDLVASFVEEEGKTRVEQGDDGIPAVDDDNDKDIQDDDVKTSSFDFEAPKEILMEIFGCNLCKGDDGHGDEDRRKILGEVEAACDLIGRDNTSYDFKRGLMASLRKRGFDAGLCKSRWEKTGRFPGGEYQFVDVNVNGVRYIVEASLAGQFEIARPNDQFNLLVGLLPPIFVGVPDELKQVVRVLSGAIKQSLRSRGLLVPPWRKSGYMKAKWFSSYKRTTNRKTESKLKWTSKEERSVIGFKAPPGVTTAGCYFRGDYYIRNNKLRAGLLTEALAGHCSSS
ncbi:hypothetical protein MLD38_010558 [Melastoma candidum]|uniref:Uncharacterized protein n=1 Tax=Melastoma candidum TaxID=119954 RepID=A0ACB9R087_9MYRT|nr:hypothetical protein MLD38_010558 [Melastoma candidum]